MKYQYGVSSTTSRTELLYDPDIPLFNIYPKHSIYAMTEYIYTSMFTALIGVVESGSS